MIQNVISNRFRRTGDWGDETGEDEKVTKLLQSVPPFPRDKHVIIPYVLGSQTKSGHVVS